MKGGRSEARDPPFSARGRPEHSLRNAGWLNYRKAPQAAHWATFTYGAYASLCSWGNARLIRMKQLGTRKNNIMPAFLCSLNVTNDINVYSYARCCSVQPQRRGDTVYVYVLLFTCRIVRANKNEGERQGGGKRRVPVNHQQSKS
jgi:hypothetical protein